MTTAVMSQKLRLYVIEEQEIYKDLYKGLFSNSDWIEFKGTGGNGDFAATRRQLASLVPDVLLMSITRLEGNVVEELQQIREAFPKTGVVLTFLLYNPENVRQLRKIAAGGGPGMALLLKQSLGPAEQLHSIVRSVADGHVVLDPSLTSLMFGEGPSQAFMGQLTAREVEIIELVSKGYTNMSIAEKLFIDVRTVHHHINNVYSKLKSSPRFNSRNPRVSATRLYLETTGELAKTVPPT